MSHKRLLAPKFIGTTPEIALQLPDTPEGLQIFLKSLYFHNTSSQAVVIQLWYCVADNAGDPIPVANSNRFMNFSLGPQETYPWEFNYPWLLENPGDTIYLQASAGNAITVILFGGTNQEN